MKTKSTTFQWCLPVLAAIALAPVASALTINFSVHHSDDDGSITSANLSGPDGVAASIETWNLPSISGEPLPSQSNLLDASGATTGVGVSFVDLGGPDDWGYGSALKLLYRSGRQFYNGPGNAGSFSITGLTPGDTYNLWIASSHISGEATKNLGDWSTSNTNTTGASVAVDNTGQETNGSNWVAGANPTDARFGFNGFQLVTAVPEPSTALLAGFGLLGFLRRRRA